MFLPRTWSWDLVSKAYAMFPFENKSHSKQDIAHLPIIKDIVTWSTNVFMMDTMNGLIDHEIILVIVKIGWTVEENILRISTVRLIN